MLLDKQSAHAEMDKATPERAAARTLKLDD
jgi:hypothetical protein